MYTKKLINLIGISNLKLTLRICRLKAIQKESQDYLNMLTETISVEMKAKNTTQQLQIVIMFLLNFTYITLPKLKFSIDMHVASVLGQYALE